MLCPEVGSGRFRNSSRVLWETKQNLKGKEDTTEPQLHVVCLFPFGKCERAKRDDRRRRAQDCLKVHLLQRGKGPVLVS